MVVSRPVAAWHRASCLGSHHVRLRLGPRPKGSVQERFSDIGGSVSDLVWLEHAHSALKAAIAADPSAGAKVQQLVEDESVGSEGIAEAILLWVDCLIEATPNGNHTGPYPVPDIWPADMSQEERWPLQLLGARLNEDQDAVNKFLRQATESPDHGFDYALRVVIMVGAGLRRLTPAQDGE